MQCDMNNCKMGQTKIQKVTGIIANRFFTFQATILNN